MGPFGMPGQFGGMQYQPSSYFQQYPPQPPQAPQQSSSFQGITTVHGADGANACIVPPNSRVLLMDDSDARFWVKEVDNYNIARMQEYKFKAVDPPKQAPPTGYVSVDEFNKLKQELAEMRSMYGQSNIREPEPVTVTAEPVTESDDR